MTKKRGKQKSRKYSFQLACFFCRTNEPPLYLIDATIEGQSYDMLLCNEHHAPGQKVIATINCNFCMILSGEEITEFELKKISKKDFSYIRDRKTKEIKPSFSEGMCTSCREKLLDYVTKHPKI